MTANLTTITLGTTVLELAKGDEITVTTNTGQVYSGQFVSLTATRGLRFRSNGAYITRKMSVVTDVELRGDDGAPATGEATVFAEVAPVAEQAPVLSDAAVDSEFAALIANSTEFGHGLTQIEQLVEATAAEQAATAKPSESNEDAAAADAGAADYDHDPIINGKHLSTLKFAEVMELAKQYKTPGRGVARIQALREGVALAISQEVGRLASQS